MDIQFFKNRLELFADCFCGRLSSVGDVGYGHAGGELQTNICFRVGEFVVLFEDGLQVFRAAVEVADDD